MPISLKCPQGHALSVKDELAGHTFRCPQCESVVFVPGNETSEEDEDSSTYKLSTSTEEKTSAEPNLDWGEADKSKKRSPSVTGHKKRKRTTKRRSAAPAQKRTPKEVFIAAASGGVLLILILAFTMLGGSEKATESPEQNVAQNAPNSSPSSDPINSPSEIAASEPVLEMNSGENAQPVSIDPATSQGIEFPDAGAIPDQHGPHDLVRFQLEPRLDSYEFPGKTWGFAYDEPTGRLALTNDERGILVYDINRSAEGHLVPIAEFPVEGRPMGLCLKPLPDRRVFVFSDETQPRLRLVDVETLRVVDEILLTDLSYADFLTGSPNPDDPYLYFSHQIYDRNQELTNDSDSADRIGRVNLLSKVQDISTEQQATDMTLSWEGSLMYVRPNSTADGMVARWSESKSLKGNTALDIIGTWSRTQLNSPVQRLVHRYAIKGLVVAPLLSAGVKFVDFAPCLEFSERPVVLGLSESAIVLGSANDFRRHATIPLPEKWLRTNRIADPYDPRVRHELSPNVRSTFFEAACDNLREIGLICFDERLIVVPLNRFELPAEPSLRVRQPPLSEVVVGQPIEIPLTTASKGATIEVVGNSDGLPSIGRRQARVLGAEASAEAEQLKIPLSASILGAQEIIYIENFELLSGLSIPFKIKIDDEVMTVTKVDDFKESLIVKRDNPQPHRVTSPIIVLTEDQNRPKPQVSLPEVTDNTFRWTPGADQIGTHLIRLRASHGKLIHEWFWNVTVKQAYEELPFYLTGVECQVDSNRAVVWGQTPPPKVLSPAMRNQPQEPDENQYFLGVYDLEQRQLLEQIEVPFPIGTATIGDAGVFASYTQLDPAESASIAKTQLVRFDPSNLESMVRTELGRSATRITIVSDKYLAVEGRGKGAIDRLNVADLTPAQPDLTTYPFPIAGRVSAGPIWDGVLWDKTLSEPRLMLHPVHFEQVPHVHSEANLLSSSRGSKIYIHTFGSHACTWSAQQAIFNGQHVLGHSTASLECRAGDLNLYSHANTTRVHSLSSRRRPDASIRLMDPMKGVKAGLSRQELSRRRASFNGYASEANGRVCVALQGKLFLVPLTRLYSPETPFRFEERQDTFVLELESPTTVSYSAPGATIYTLRAWYARPAFGDEEPVINQSATDGIFQLELSDREQLISFAIQHSIVYRPGLKRDELLEMIEAHLEKITPIFNALTSRDPVGIPVPLFVSVTADHSDGVQKAGLAHAYLIEVPLEEIRERLK